MTLQNRVNPWGEIVATQQRGTMMGNRGGKFHRDDRTLSKRRWASRHWICCDLDYKGLHHEAMGKGYTSLFFLDEVTALAAGHRPCFFCRRRDAKRFLGPIRANAFDRQLHDERLLKALTLRSAAEGGTSKGWQPAEPTADASRRAARTPQHEDIITLPDGAMIEIEGEAYAMKGSASAALVICGLYRRHPPQVGERETFDSTIDREHPAQRL